MATGTLVNSSYGPIVSPSKNKVGHLIVGSLALPPMSELQEDLRPMPSCWEFDWWFHNRISWYPTLLASSRVDASFRGSYWAPKTSYQDNQFLNPCPRNFVHRLYDTNRQRPKRTDCRWSTKQGNFYRSRHHTKAKRLRHPRSPMYPSRRPLLETLAGDVSAYND
jgi:hypothetical protein